MFELFACFELWSVEFRYGHFGQGPRVYAESRFAVADGERISKQTIGQYGWNIGDLVNWQNLSTGLTAGVYSINMADGLEGATRKFVKLGAITRVLGVTTVVLVISLALLCIWKDSNIVAAALSGGVLGWLIGMLLSPKITESERFDGWAKGIAGFATGTLFTKLIDGIDKLAPGSIWNQDVLHRTSMFFIWLIVALINSFVWREYNALTDTGSDTRTKKIEGDGPKTKIK
jgi:hypothetical protein